MNAPSDLGGEYIETFGPKDAGGSLVRDRKSWRDGQVISGVESDGLIHHA